MKTLNTLIIFSLIVLNGYAQCNFENLFPVKHGLSKFEAINQMSSMENLKDDSQNYSMDVWNSWLVYNDGKDSSYTSTLFYKYLDHPCFNGESTIKCSFVDDKLYKFLTIIHFSKDEYNKCFNNYNSLISAIKTKFDYSDTYILKNGGTNEQTGEGIDFSTTPFINETNKGQNVLVTVRYHITTHYSTNEPTGYDIRMTFKDTQGTIFEE